MAFTAADIAKYGEPVSPSIRAWQNGGAANYAQARLQGGYAWAAEQPTVKLQQIVNDARQPTSVCTSDRNANLTGILPPAGWHQEHTAVTPAPVYRSGGCGCTQTKLEQEVIAEWQAKKAAKQAEPVKVYAEYKPEFDPDLYPELDPVPIKPIAVPVPVAASTPPTAAGKQGKNYVPAVKEPEPEPELPLPQTSEEFQEWRKRRYVWSAGAPVQDPATTNYVPVDTEAEEESQLVVTAHGFSYTGRFAYLEPLPPKGGD